VVVIGAGLGGLAAALELRRRGFEVTVLERHAEVGGKASDRREGDGWRWDEGPSIVVLPWVYRELFLASGLDPDHYLPLNRLDPAFRIMLPDGRALDIAASEQGLRDAFATIDAHDAGPGLTSFLAKADRFSAMLGHAYCDRSIENWGQVAFSPLMVSASIISPFTSYRDEIDSHFRSPLIRELMYGFPTYSGFDPKTAPASLVIIPWTIIREGVWYPASGGIRAIPLAMRRACLDQGVTIRTGVEVEAIERDETGRVRGVATSSGTIAARVVVSNADYIRTHELLRGGPALPPAVEALRQGRAEPSSSYLTLQLACDRTWGLLAHHLLILTPGAGDVYSEIFDDGVYPADPALYVNTTSTTDPDDAPNGGSNPFIVVGVPSLRAGVDRDEDQEHAYAERVLDRLEASGLEGLRGSIQHRVMKGPTYFRHQFDAFRGSIYGLSQAHNILGGGFRPINERPEVPGLFFAGGGVQPGAGMPMAVQSGKITAELVAKRVGRKGRALASARP
jgi:phytoene desaturase